ncbi:hypothetical protein KR100_12615 [Synechococcus sp. KORDI-100]|uniref:glycosyltransferase n=1 Tax=Synechococcus sp. KORDI-100 TaxID=1280380 RepID=UPI0004E06F6C|nr:glycosyltransferase [Synechococcus sp. KORDI-100]AII44193.1 hypothetical protein KR100_12615 [Synechococcus sp. KORDI-100]
MHYFQIRLNEPISCAPYQPLRISQAGATSMVFLPFGEGSITLAGSPSDYTFELLGSTDSVEERLSFRTELTEAITLLDLSHWLFQRSSRVNTPQSCAALRLNNEWSTSELVTNLHTIYLNHLTQPDAEFELNCRASDSMVQCQSIVDLARSCRGLYEAAKVLNLVEHPVGKAVDIIIPTYGQPAFTLRCIASVLRDLLISRQHLLNHFDVRIKVVDDAHPQQDGHVVLQQLADQGCLDFAVNDSNLGFLESCNQAVSTSRSESFIVLLNNDIEVLPGWLLGLIETFQQQQNVGLAGSKLIYPDGRLQEAGGIVWRDGSAWNYGRLKKPTDPEFNYARSADYISGASIMVERSLWDAIGGFDRRYVPAYYEDTDLALTIREQGLIVVFQPTSQAIHHEGISNGTDLGQGIKAYQTANQLKFLDKWRDRLGLHQVNGQNLALAKNRGSLGNILVIENLLLDPEGDAGSLFMMNYCLALQELGYAISYVPMDNLCRMDDKALLMGSRGINVLAHPQIESLDDVFKKDQRQFDLILIARPGNIRHLATLKQGSPGTPIAYFTHDLHFLRTRRTADNLSDPKEQRGILRKSDRLKALETEIFGRVDLVLHISEAEDALAQTLHPHASVVLHPVVSAPSQLRCQHQRDKATSVLFVGNFAHAPNVTAALWLVETIWPLVKAQRPDLQLLIAGKSPPIELKTDASVEILGYVEDLSELLNSVGLGVAPLLEGAGVKGKVLSALAHGLPMVTTSIGAEGIIHDERRCDALAQADSAEAFAAEILAYFDLSQDEQQHRADIGRQFIDDHFSSSSLVQRLISMLKSFDLPYHSHTSSFIPYQPRSSDRRFNHTNSFNYWSHPLA